MRWPPPSDWPNAAFSRQVQSRPHRWHVQSKGSGDTVLLLHGAGASSHSFAALLPLIAERHHAVAIDLPGQGYTRLGARHRSGLAEMSRDIEVLLDNEGLTPTAIVGHSAGGAIALHLAQSLGQRHGQPPRVVGLNAALSHFKGVAGVLFPAMAKLLALTPFAAQVMARSSGTPERVRALIESTGSVLPPGAIDAYHRLASDRDHIDGTLLMMAQWSLDKLLSGLPDCPVPTCLVTAELDAAVPPAVAVRAAAQMPEASVKHLPGLGHLAHEEDPALVARVILSALARFRAKGAVSNPE